MSFLFKSKKGQDRALGSRDGPPGSSASVQSAAAMRMRDEKGSLQRSTPTGSLNSIDNDGSVGSPDHSFGRQRGQSVTGEHQQQQQQQNQSGMPLYQQPLQQQSQQQPPSDLPFRNGPGAPTMTPTAGSPNASLYPWSQRRLTHTSSHPSPFPRYGAAVNSLSSKEGDIYVMGGLIGSATVKGDLWMIEAGGNMACYPLGTTSEGPGPRVGHASLLVGNAFIVYGGDTKIDEADVLDETLYLLNTSTRQWSRALPSGARPCGRYGHSLNILGSRIYIFGGQVEGFFMNDLASFDLNQLQTANNKWDLLISNTEGGGGSSGKVPAARTNHTVVTFNDKLYLFGGTNGFLWFNDVWCYDPTTNSWSQLDCIGYIPVPREGHAATLVDDVMYIFGGRTDDGADLGDLAAFRITSRRWYTFQNMGPSPSPRSGHSMTTVGKSIVVLGGEPSSGAAAVSDLSLVYCLDTTKIRYPSDSQSQRNTVARRPSLSEPGLQSANSTNNNVAATNIGNGNNNSNSGSNSSNNSNNGNANRGMVPRDGPPGPPDARRMAGAAREAGATNSPVGGGFRSGSSADMHGPLGPIGAVNGGPGFKPPRSAGPTGPPVAQQQAMAHMAARGARNTSLERGGDGQAGVSPASSQAQSPTFQQGGPGPMLREVEGPMANTTANMSANTSANIRNGRRTPTQPQPQPQPQQPQQPQQQQQQQQQLLQQQQQQQQQQQLQQQQQQASSRSGSRQGDSGAALMDKSRAPRPGRRQDSSESPPIEAPAPQKPMSTRPSSPPPPTRQASNPLSRRSSARNSQTVAVLKELDSARNRNAWYASELELARKAGYVPNASLSPMLDAHVAETFDDEDRPLIEALIAMRTELANVQSSVDKQAVLAAKQIAEAEKQRDSAIQEAIYAKAKLAALTGGGNNTLPLIDDEDNNTTSNTEERAGDISRKLASALNTQKELQNQMELLSSEMDAEKRARRLADDTANAAQKRMAELETYKQQTSSEMEQLRAELHMVHREAREQSVAAAEAVAAAQLLRVEKAELETEHREVIGSAQESSSTFAALREAVAASAETKSVLEQKLEEERTHRETVEAKLGHLKAEHEARTAELLATTQRLRDAEELAERHANEARTHREAVLAGLDRAAARDVNSAGSNSGNNRDASERIAALQSQLETANALVRKYQLDADAASDKLRSAEERIAGLEAYQEQASREGVSIRRQLQSALRDTQSLQAANSDLQHRLANQQLETNAITVQHNTLKELLGERGISPTSAAATATAAAVAATTSPRMRGLTSSPRDGSPEPMMMMRLRELEHQLAAAVAAHEETKTTAATQAQDSETAYREKLAQLENDYESAVHYVKGTEKMLKQLKEQLSRYKAENSRLKEQVTELEEQQHHQEGSGGSPHGDWEAQRRDLQSRVDALQAELQASSARLEKQLQAVGQDLADARHERDVAVHDSEEAARRLEGFQKDREQLQEENALLERRALDAEHKVGSLLDQMELSVDNYRRRSRQVPNLALSGLAISDRPASSSGGGNNGVGGGMGGGANGANHGSSSLGHSRQTSSEVDSVYDGASATTPTTNTNTNTNTNMNATHDPRDRDSAALDSLANELDMLRSHWEATNRNYRLSNSFDFEPAGNGGGGASLGRSNRASIGLSESLADWRKRLDDTHPGSPPGASK